MNNDLSFNISARCKCGPVVIVYRHLNGSGELFKINVFKQSLGIMVAFFMKFEFTIFYHHLTNIFFCLLFLHFYFLFFSFLFSDSSLCSFFASSLLYVSFMILPFLFSVAYSSLSCSLYSILRILFSVLLYSYFRYLCFLLPYFGFLI